MEQIPNVSVANTADMYLEAADVLEHSAFQSGNANLSWVACINAALASEIYLKSFLAETVLTAMSFGGSMENQKTERGHDLLELYSKIEPDIQALILSASQRIDQNFGLIKTITHCKDYFFHARYSHELESLKALNSDVVALARHMKALVRVLAETTHPRIVKP